MKSAGGPELSAGEDGFQLVSVGAAVVHIWRDASTPRKLGLLMDSTSLLHRRRQGPIVSLCVLGREAPIPEPAVRTLLKEQFESMRGRLSAAAFVLEKDGVEGVLSRTVLKTLVTLARSPFQVKICSQLAEAVNFLTQFAEAPQSAELFNAVTRAEAELTRRRSVRAPRA